MTTRDALGVNKPALTGGTAAEPLSQEPARLLSQLEARCRTSRQVYGRVDLRALISALGRDGVDPGVATEALIKADCGSVPEVVQWMVAEGGKPVIEVVMTRAMLLAKPGSKWTIETAATAGLKRNASGTGRVGTEDIESSHNGNPGHATSGTLPSTAPMTMLDAPGGKAPLPADGAASEQARTDPVQLENQLAPRCRKSRQVYGRIELATLVSVLYREGVKPAVATEALIKADCGSASDVVEEMVAEGGEPIVAAVVNRALLLARPGAKWTIETAAKSGLERNVADVDRAETKDTGSRHGVSAGHDKAETPLWPGGMATADAPGNERPMPAQGAAAEPWSKKPARLTSQLAANCRQMKKADGKVELAPLISNLYRDGVRSAVATEALIKADCGSVTEVVQGMVAEGGEPVRAEVMKQALPLAKPGTKWMIESAATAGVGDDAVASAPSDTGGGRNVLDYVMGFFGRGAAETDNHFVVPYGSGIPGYGIYTFILLGGGNLQSGEQDWDRYRELLRVVQGYVLATETETADSGLQRHVFVVPVRPDLRGESLEEQTVHALSAQMRDALALYFDQAGRSDISDSLRKNSGPLLVSSLEPTLVPKGPTSVRMVTDLSEIGSEFLYAVIDAYDRPIPEELIGRVESFDPIHLRLSELFTIVEGSVSNRQQRRQPWIQIFGAEPRDKANLSKPVRRQLVR